MLICLNHVLQYSPRHHARALEVPATRKNPFRHQVLMMAQHPARSNALSSSTLKLEGGGGERDASLTNPAYYLIWSPTFLPKTVASIGILFLIRTFWASRVSLFPVLPRNERYSSIIATSLEMILLPLLSSACCSVQLLINVMVGAGGCAGFNKYLGPIRPYFLGILLSVIFQMIAARNVTSWPKLIVQLLLAFLPEIVHAWNSGPFCLAFGGSRGRTKKDAAGTTFIRAQAEMTIPGMGCVACINKINKSLQGFANVIGSEAWLVDSGGKALVQYVVASEAEVKDVAIQLAHVVREAGFDQCLIGSVRTISSE